MKKKHSLEETKTVDSTESAPPAAAAPPEEPNEQQLLDAAQQEMDGLKDRMLRLQADFDNFRKRVRRDAQDQCLVAAEGILKELLPVIDHFDLGLKSAAEQGAPAPVIDGLRLVRDQLAATLARFGLEPVESVGQVFDPHVHESMALLPSPDIPRDHVAAETRKGYRLGPRLLRAAQVIVSTGPETAPSSGNGEG